MTVNPYAKALEQKGKSLFVPFVVLGDPDKQQSVEIIRRLVQNGADALELGLPFSDPPADGPIIQAADTRALEAGIHMNDCFEILKEVRAFTSIPIGLLVYYNLVLQRGVKKFYQDCKASRVDSVLIADLPLEHIDEILPIANEQGISPVLLVSEITSEERMEKIAKIAHGYLYVVSYLGVTGAGTALLEDKIRHTITLARKYTDLPLIVGFGINTVEQITAAIHAGADGIIIGSRIVKEIPHLEKIAALSKELSEVIA